MAHETTAADKIRDNIGAAGREPAKPGPALSQDPFPVAPWSRQLAFNREGPLDV
jgi:hypothetical protein